MVASEHNPTIEMGTGRSRRSDLVSPPPSHQVPFDTLATEIIQDIFIYACPNLSLPIEFDSNMNPAPVSTVRYPLNYVDPMMLAMVCKRWREITVAYRSLWATISIEASRISAKDWDRWGLAQLRDCLERSGTCPLRISINLGQQHGNDNSAISGILDVVIPHSKRWTDIDFVRFSLDKFVRKFDSLSAPSLKRLGLWDTDMKDFGSIQLPWKQITDITLNTWRLESEQEWHRVLSQLPVSLMELTFSDLAECNGSKSKPPITLPKVQRLRFLCRSNGILDMLICPSLDQLDLDVANTREIKRFLDNNTCALTHIHLGDIHDIDGILQHSSLSHVKSISLATIPDPVLHLLAFDSRHLFPCLKTLFLDLYWADRDDNAKLIDTSIERLQEILNSRTYGIHVIYHEIPPDSVRPDFILGSSPINFSAHVFRKPLQRLPFTTEIPYIIYGV